MTASVSTPTATFDNRDAFAEELAALARQDERIVVVCNDSIGSSKLGAFQKEFPERLINVGIAEQNLIGVGAGLANGGMIPVVSGASPFLTARSLEQVKADLAYSQYPVIMAAQSPGMSYGELGPTHHSIEDLAFMRALPGMDIIVPADRRETSQAVRLAVNAGHPTFIRVGRFPVPDVNPQDSELQRGRWTVVREGTDAAILAIGTMVSRALEAADVLAGEGLDVRVVNAAFVAPMDLEELERAARTGVVVTAEEANVSGGLGAGVASVVAQRPGPKVAMRILGVKDSFAPTGTNDFLLEYFGLTSADIVRATREARHE